MIKKLCQATSAAAFAALSVGTAWGYDEPSVNLGFTSFLDGGPPAGPGFYATPYFNYYHADRFKDGPPVDSKLNVYAELIQAVYQSDLKLPTSVRPGFDLIVPFATFDLSSPALRANSGGMGDVLAGPFLQWDPIMGKQGPIFMTRVEFQCITPTGKYDPTMNLNPGANFFSFDPYWSGTLFITPKWTVSTRVHYLWNDENTNPGPGASKKQAGQAVHLNFATDYEVFKGFRPGINGYYLKQVTGSTTDGVGVASPMEEVLGLGPGFLWSITKNNHLFVNTYFEMGAQSRTEGFRLNLRYVYHF